MVSPRHTVIAIVGPTATGKSALAEALARTLDGEIVSADSMQVYKGMDIGTAKIPLGENASEATAQGAGVAAAKDTKGGASSERASVHQKQPVPYHCIDLVLPGEEFNASKYQRAARSALDDIIRRDKQPIICGGTGLYVRAALEEFVPVDEYEDEAHVATREARRARLTAQCEEMGPEAFHASLASRDPESAALIHPNNTRRVIRAFEWLEEGSSYAEQSKHFDTHQQVYPAVYLGLDMPREKLYAESDKRVDRMLQCGLLTEVSHLLDEGYGQALTALQAIGYKELIGVLGGTEDLDEAVAQIKKATRNYVKRQKSWFRRDTRIHWLDAALPLTELTREALAIINAQEQHGEQDRDG